MPVIAPVIETRDLHVRFGATRVLRGVDLAIDEGEFVGVVGPNGSGKTTLLRTMVGQLRPTSGDAFLWGRPAHACHERERIGYVPQHATDLDRRFPATALEVALLGRVARRGLLRGWTRADRQHARDALELVGVAALADRRIGELSGGQRQRVMLAKALATEPDLLILDEPTTGIDPRAREDFYQLLDRLNHEEGLTVLLVSHDDQALRIACHRMVGLNQTVVFDGDPADFEAAGGYHDLYELHVPHEYGHEGADA